MAATGSSCQKRWRLRRLRPTCGRASLRRGRRRAAPPRRRRPTDRPGPAPPPRGPALSPQGPALSSQGPTLLPQGPTLLPRGPALRAALAVGRHGCRRPLCASGPPAAGQGGCHPHPWRWGCPEVLEAAVGARTNSSQRGAVRGWIILVSSRPGPPGRHGPWVPQTRQPSFIFSLGCWGCGETAVCPPKSLKPLETISTSHAEKIQDPLRATPKHPPQAALTQGPCAHASQFPSHCPHEAHGTEP